MEENTLKVDVDKILQSKMGSKARFVPGFVSAYLKHILHQDELNAFLANHSSLEGIDFMDAGLNYLGVKIDVKGIENLPDDGRNYTFVSNHPLGGIDGIAIGSVLGHHYNGRIKYLVNDLLMNLKPLAPLFVGINKTGSQSKNLPRLVEQTFKSDNHVIMFPAGLCSRKHNGVIKDLEWKKTFVTKSIETERDVVPIHFEGHNSNFFYNLANVCKFLGIKFNIAMLYLADEMVKNKGQQFTITIGKPIPYSTFSKSKTPVQWAQYVKDLVYKL